MEYIQNVKNIGFISVLILSSLLLMLPAFGADFTSQVVPNSTSTATADYVRFNVTVENTDDTTNITEVVVILYNVDFEFIPGNTSNGTSLAPGSYNFTSISNKELRWDTENPEGIIPNGSSALFWFNASVPSSSGTYTITIKTLDTNSSAEPQTQNKTITIDNSAPVITLHSPNGVNQTNSSVTFNWSVTDSIDNVKCDLLIDGVENKSNFQVATTGYHTETVDGLLKGWHNWSLECWDDFENTDNSSTYFFGLFPDLIVSELTWGPQNDRLNATSSINVTAKIKNVGDFAIEETYATNDTYYHAFNITLKMNGVVKYYIPVNASLDPEEEVLVYSEFPIENIGLGERTLLVEILNQDSTGTFVLDESDKTNNYAEEEFYSGYVVNVTVNNITDPQINENELIELVMDVDYSNGDPVTGLELANFTSFKDTYDDDDVNVTGSSFNETVAGLYTINAMTPGLENGRSEPGFHNITVTVTGKNSSGDIMYYGIGETAYELFAPDVILQLGVDTSEVRINEYMNFEFILKNLGNLNVTDVNLRVWKISGSGSVSVVNGVVSDSIDFCDNVNIPSGDQTVCKYDTQNLKLKGTGIGDYLLGIRVNYTENSNDYYYYIEYGFNIINATTSGDDGGGDSDTVPPVSLGGEGASCDSSKDCKSGYWCNNGKCERLKQDIDILNFPQKVEMLMGDSSTFEVEIKNTGVTVSLTKLTVTVDGIDVSIVPASRALLQSETFKYMVTVTAGDSVDVGKYSGSLTASIATDTNIKQTKSFEVHVLPTEEKKAEINELYANYSGIFTDVKADFEHFKSLGFVEESELTTVQTVFDALERTMGDAEEALGTDDYVTAYISLKQFNNFYNQFNAEMEKLEYVQTENMSQQWSGVWVWVIVGILALSAGGLFTYKFILTEGYNPKMGYKPKRNLLTQIKANLNLGKDKIMGIKTKVNMNVNSLKKPFTSEAEPSRTVNYSPGYEKRVTKEGYNYSGASAFNTSVNKVKDLLRRRKEKYLSDYYS